MRLRRFSAHEFAVRGRQWLLARLERVGLCLPAPGLSGDPFEADPARLGAWLGSGKSLSSALQNAASRRPGLVSQWRRDAAAIRSGQLSLLGRESLSVGNPPAWHVDPVSGVCAPDWHWSRIPTLDPAVVGDHKFVWEINRHQYLISPAVLWLLEGDDANADLVQDHLESWIAENPPGRGINWTSSLELAYRSITWCWLLRLLREARWRDGLRSTVLQMLERQANQVARHLSTYFSPNTHLTGEALGLCYVAATIPTSSYASRFRDLGRQILDAQILKQVHEDGVHFEQATHYQRYTAEIYLHYLSLAEACQWPVAPHVQPRLGKLLEVLRHCADSDGRLPPVGDDDGGFLFPIGLEDPSRIADLLLAGAAAIHAPERAAGGEPDSLLADFLFPGRAPPLVAPIMADPPAGPCRLFRVGGIVVVRDGWHPRAAVATIDAGPHGAMNCGHAHADALAMTLTLGPRPLLVDRGTLTYVGAERNEFRATSSHNTLEFDGESSVEPLGPFQWGRRPSPPSAQLQEYGALALFHGTAEGHFHTERRSRHERHVGHLRDGAWVVADKGIRAGSAATARWQFDAGLDIRPTQHSGFDVLREDGALMAHVRFVGQAGLRLRHRSISPRYGRSREAMVAEADVGPGRWLVTVLIPRTPGDGIELFEHDAGQPGLLAWRQGESMHCVASGNEGCVLAPQDAHSEANSLPQVVWQWGSKTSGFRTCVAIYDITDPIGQSRASVLRLQQTGSDTMPRLEVLEILDPDRCAASAA
jgi:hypothetical protein